ncbi:hypothetical protein GOODEAATRI_021248, partial [Goodea atripinnis]
SQLCCAYSESLLHLERLRRVPFGKQGFLIEEGAADGAHVCSGMVAESRFLCPLSAIKCEAFLKVSGEMRIGKADSLHSKLGGRADNQAAPTLTRRMDGLVGTGRLAGWREKSLSLRTASNFPQIGYNCSLIGRALDVKARPRPMDL